jgi:hypothetical protein
MLICVTVCVQMLICVTVCADADCICDVSFSVLKEDPHSVMVQSATVPGGTVEVNHGQNCTSDKTPSMEDKLQEVEKVIILQIPVNTRICSAHSGVRHLVSVCTRYTLGLVELNVCIVPRQDCNVRKCASQKHRTLHCGF